MILDKNDSPPEFKNIPPAYFASEDLAPGQLIATITAEDPDTIGTITYSIETEEPTPFVLNGQNGQLTLKEPLDRETISEYRVVIRADDGVQSTHATVVIQVSHTKVINAKFAYLFVSTSSHNHLIWMKNTMVQNPHFGSCRKMTYLFHF